SSPNPSVPSQSVTVSVTVTGPGSTPTGTVTFTDNGTSLGTRNLNGSGTASLATSTLSLGSHTLAAVYSGDGGHPAATATTLQAVLSSATPTLTSSPNPSVYGQTVTFTATLTGSSGTPTGKVIFEDNGGFLGVRYLSGGMASLSTS